MNSHRAGRIVMTAIRFTMLFWFVGSVTPLRASPEVSCKIQIDLDARDLPRHLLHARLKISCEPGRLALWYPKWIPGTHAPCGPLDTIGGLRIETSGGKTIPWHRDQVELYRLTCEVPENTREIWVQLDTICNAPAVNASGHLSYGNGSLGIINWPTCLLYPEGPSVQDIQVSASLRLPPGWKYATALRSSDEKDGLLRFAPVSLSTLADSPLIAGEHMRTIPLAVGNGPAAFLHLASESPAALQLAPDVVSLYSRMVQEAGALFGAFHYSEFHFLITCSDELGRLGLEHHSSSLNGVGERDLIDAANRKGWIANLIPHEYVHSWCGKYRRPVGQCTPDFHTPQRTSLLWVYEGLAEYVGELLMVRSGLATPQEYRELLTSRISTLMLQSGRNWRSLEDTAVVSHLLRSRSSNWNELRRGQDYYFEGALVWMEADAIIRQQSQGARSLDDFCRKFMGPNSSHADVIAYDLPEIIRLLTEMAAFDWEAFLNRRIYRPLDALPLDLVGRIGYRLEYSPHPPPPEHDRDRGSGGISALHSLGLNFSNDGRITDVVPGMAGDRARLAPGLKVMGINNRLFTPRRLQDALADSVADRKIELMLLEGDRFRTLVLEYADGPRYLELVRDDSKPDLLADILKPIAQHRK
jgi:predicted metalloprotease with PDZ domain